MLVFHNENYCCFILILLIQQSEILIRDQHMFVRFYRLIEHTKQFRLWNNMINEGICMHSIFDE